jgi:thioesterase domain-containing protein/acyl carrier protein
MVPSVFVPLAQLPVNSSGKIDRRALSQMPLRQREAQMDARDELEDTIARIWAEALGLTRVDVTHNFFELGGNSLMALNVLSKIEERTGCHLPATALFDAGTVEQIACVVRERGNPRRAAGTLVRLQPHGTKRPLILVPPAGGSLICYSEVARLLGPDQPVSGIELPPGKPPDTVEGLAAQYITQLDAAAYGQPLHLGGWSFGGVVAFEMARQLTGRNRPVENVVVFDSRLIHEGEDPDETDILIEIGRVQALARGIEFRLKGGSLRRLEPHHRAMFIAAQMNRASGARLETIAMELNTTLRLFQANMRAARRYVPREYGGCVTLLRAAGEQPAGDYGWSRYCPGLTVRDVPGTHRGMLAQPRVMALEKILRDSLESSSRQKCATAAS